MLRVEIATAGYTEEASIQDVFFQIQEGELVALIGANGAGKSTTIKAILGLLPHVKGNVMFPEGAYAYVPEQPIYYDYLTLWEHLELLAAVREFKGWEERGEELLRIFRLTEHKHEYLTQFSKGMKQKSMLVLAFLAQPQMYIVDEPFVGLDPTAVRDFLLLLERERQRGAGILLCTHVLDTAERLCERFLLVSDGTLVADGSLADLQGRCRMPGAPLTECFYVLTELRHG
ncbi:ABC transporter ATP-binding protein [Ectobacillus ponti]|uniref:ABC transporter ATP-binding protein n=1 Tax=Ectobacillus ponti TaxID=2961894 RepID=A0AA41X927_9BACI|nr:ABC transporter ATP-binding protein [Ectobacillus ponti]